MNTTGIVAPPTEMLFESALALVVPAAMVPCLDRLQEATAVPNGTVIVAVKGDGSKAWISSDARTWTQIAWSGHTGGILALPGGVIAGDQYGAGK